MKKQYCDGCGFEFAKTFLKRGYEIFYHKSGKKYCWKCKRNMETKK